MNISSNWTNAAIVSINVPVRKKTKSKGTSNKWYISHDIIVDITVTKVTAIPIPTEFLIFVDNPKNEHSPINFISNMLFIRHALIKINIGFISLLIIFQY